MTLGLLFYAHKKEGAGHAPRFNGNSRIPWSQHSMDSLKLHYSGRVSAGRVPKRPLEKAHFPLHAQGKYIGTMLRSHGLEATQEFVSTLGLSSLSNLHKMPEPAQRKSRGSRGMTAYGRQVVRSTCQWLEDRHGHKYLSFLTLSIPPEAVQPELYENWARLTKNLRQVLSYHLRAAGLPGQLIGVVEVQERRQSDGAELPYLHWHIVFQGRKKHGPWALSPSRIDSIWRNALEEILGKDVCVKAAANIQRVKKSCVSYLGKYLSKGLKALSSINPKYLPSSWYMCTRSLSQSVKNAIRRVSGEAAEQFYHYLRSNPHLLRFDKDVYRQCPIFGRLHCGWYGDLMSRNTYREVRSALEAWQQTTR